MASRRSLGGGRILGSGKSLSPSMAVATAGNVHTRNTSLLSPSESSVSLSSQTSTTPISSETEDLASRVALDDHGPSAAASASSRLMCPICNEEMVTLLQLNRHLDDNHQNLQEAEQDEVKDWFEEQIKKAKKFQPLALLNQKLKGLDVFESNASPPPLSSTPSRSGIQSQAPPVHVESKVVDPDDAVTKSHWQRHTGHDSCSDPLCGKRLGGVNGDVNCRHCGKLFCEEHTMYQMKLSRSAQHEPVRGYWCRVCETCYKSREGYNDHAFERDHTAEFTKVRRRTVDKAYLEVSRLEKRLSRITQLLANPPPPPPDQSARSYLWSLAGSKDRIRSLEQSIVTWEDDSHVSHCPFCQQSFSQYSFRRHHCRTCGRVVCGDPMTACSAEVALNVKTVTDNGSEKELGNAAVDVRMCKDCQHTIFSKSDFDRALAVKPADQRAYENLVQFERGIRLLLPKFQRLLAALQDPDKPPTSAQLADAQKVRRRLIDAFTQYDVAARRIRDLPTNDCVAQEKLQKAVYAQATNFLHLHMLPLKSLPKIMKHASPHGLPSSRIPNGSGSVSRTNSGSPLAQIKAEAGAGTNRPDSPSRASSASSSQQITALEKEEKELNERLIVLEEQKFFVQEMIADANKRRKFDEMAALTGNVEDLDREIDSLQSQIQAMDFRGAYVGNGTD
ncbi:hypothetical protein AAFC00_002354 [Neodothiora populina]|uniref:FYVE-type domain-containing protein n=1 Tax=Neodothiora populina TaxID=2781224 RepID=A0ABR3PH61_9PEZI